MSETSQKSPAARGKSSSQTASLGGDALFSQDEVDLDARHPAHTPGEGFPAPSSVILKDEFEAFSDEDDPFAGMLTELDVPGSVSAPSPLRAAQEVKRAEQAAAPEIQNSLADDLAMSAPAPIPAAPPKPKASAKAAAPVATKSTAVPMATTAPAPLLETAPLTDSTPESPIGLKITRRYTKAGEDVWKSAQWELRTASITGGNGEIVFKQDGVEVPTSWSQMATNVVASKYFRGQVGTLEREYSVKQLVGRVADTFLAWGKEGSYFASDDDASAFHDELRYILIHQLAAFNSPVWFNLGWPGRRQAISACLPYDVRVNTDRGLIPIGEIVRLFQSTPNPRIYTYGPDGAPSRIVNAVCNGRKRVINFHLADGSTLRCTSNHRVFVRGGKGEMIEKEAGQLVPGVDRLILNRDLLMPETSDTTLGLLSPDAELAWLTGLMVGDGYCGRSRTLTSDTWDLKISTAAEKNRAEAVLAKYGVPFRTHIKSWGFCLRGHGSVSRSLWQALGIWDRVNDKAIPEWIYRTSRENVCAFLGGLFDSDGHVAKVVNRRLPVFSNTSLHLVQGVQTLLRSLGIFSSLTSYIDSREDCSRKPSYTLGIHDNVSVETFQSLIGFTHEAKQEKMDDRLLDSMASWRTPDVLLVSKSLGGPEFVYDIQTESETFWAEGVLLHNCYINEVQDDMDSILELYKTEGMLFKDGSGSGLNLSPLRGSNEPLAAGGRSSGPISFMKGLDASAGSIKSGGSTRRAACMRVLDVDHPDIIDFINCKKDAEEKAHALIEAGYSGAFNVPNGAYDTVPFQNANHSVRVTDEFMQAVDSDGPWSAKNRLNGKATATFRARDVMQKIGEATWVCGDPGMQYDTTINDWHTCANTDRIYASNPCSEFMFLNSTACNLASLNLMRFRDDKTGAFDADAYEHVCRVVLTAQEIGVGFAEYPTPKIMQRSYDYRPLGLGYANLGALLMASGLPYDSDAGRAYAASVTAIMTGAAYAQSASIARDCGGPFAGYADNKEPMLRVMKKHRAAVDAIDSRLVPLGLLERARKCWDEAVAVGTDHGYRNAQASVLAPTGCLVGGSLVLTDRGLVRLNRLGNVDGADWQNVKFRVQTDEGAQDATKFFINGLAETRRIVTHSGYAIQGTLKHRIKVVDKATGEMTWKRFAEIVSGDVVALTLGGMLGEPITVTLPPLGEEYWTGDYTTVAPRTMTADLAELIGYFMGDGSMHSKGPRFCVANADLDVAERIKSLVHSLFNLRAKVTPQQGYYEVAVHSIPLAIWWEACGFTKILPSADHTGKGYRPHIPDAVLATNDPSVYGAFLRGLYEADGTVTGGIPCWSTVCREFSEEVKALLLSLGIPTSTRQTRTGWSDNPMWVMRLRNTSYTPRFLEAVSFIGERKTGAVSLSGGVQTARHDYVYLGKSLIDELIPSGSPLRDAAQLAMRRHEGAITRRMAQNLLERTGDARLAHALGFFYDRIVVNEDGGEQMTYDLSVPANVTYIAGGFISHNTIGFLMDCDTTGVEPDIAIVKYKSLVGGGMMKIVNQTVPEALRRLGYSDAQIKSVLEFIDQNDTIEGAPELKKEHLPIFDCAFRPTNGTRTIHYTGHVKMMAAVQPFLSGAISKTVNVPEDATAEEIAHVYVDAWKMGIKAIAVYRDNSKKTQPLSTKRETPSADKALVEVVKASPVRRKLPDERPSITHKFSVGGHEGYLTVGLYPETNMPGEIFLRMSKEGSTISGLMDGFATAVSLSLQYGVPLATLVDKFIHSRFEPSGFTGNKDIPMAKSVMDYIFRWLALKFLQKEERQNVGLIADQDLETPAAQVTLPVLTAPPALPKPNGNGSITASKGGGAKPEPVTGPAASFTDHEREIYRLQADAPPCPECGALCIRSGACYKCLQCGTSLGCS